MLMETGIHTDLFLTWWDGAHKQVWLENVDAHNTAIPGVTSSTDDPYWRILDDATKKGDRQEGIKYKEADGSDWLAKVRAHYGEPNPAIAEVFTKLWFDVMRTNDADRHDTDHITVIDWKGVKYKVTVLGLAGNLPQQPKFDIQKL